MAISVFRAPQSRGGSVFMQGLEAGDQLEITQPLQNFPLRVGAPRYVLLAGGIGITAMVNMARVLRNIKADYTLVYVGRSRAAMAYLPQLEALHGDALRVHVDDEGTALKVDELLAGVDPETELYMCGPIRLMDAVKRGWDARGLSVAEPAVRDVRQQRLVRPGGIRRARAAAGRGDDGRPRRVHAGSPRGRRGGHDVRLPQGRMRPV